MFRCEGLGALPALRGPVATLGTFDGVHLGHQRVIREAMKWASEIGGESVVVTFDRHPRRVIVGQAPALITSVEHRLKLFEELGVDVAVVLKFDTEIAGLAAEEFARRYFIDWLHVKGVLLGFDCAFGKGREGNIALLKELGCAAGFDARVCAPVECDGETVSSTAVRQEIERGALDIAGRMLGRPFSLLGTVVHGAGLGRAIGFPTANLNLHHEAIPPNGVYLTRTLLAGQEYPSLVNIGTRPTVTHTPAADRIVEVYVEGLDRTLYGEDLEVQFVRKLREEIEFSSMDALKARMAEDRRIMLAELGA